MCILFPLLCSCQYYGASILAYSSAANPDSYAGPVYAVAGDAPADGWAQLQAHTTVFLVREDRRPL